MNFIDREIRAALHGGRAEIFRLLFTTVLFVCCSMTSLMLVPTQIGVMGAVLASLMLTIAFIDARRFIIPDELTAAGVIFGLLYASLQSDGQVANALILATVQGAALAAFFGGLRIAYRWFRGRDGLGFGDVKLAGVAGTWLMPATIPLVIEVAALSGLAVYIIRQYCLGHPLSANGRLPFGAFFAPAIWLGWVFEVVMAGRY